MKKKSRRLQGVDQLIDRDKTYSLQEAIGLMKQVPAAKFDETVELSMKLGVDPRHADQMVRGSVLLPNGLGKTKTVLVFAKGDKAKEAEDAGADYVGDEDLVNKISGGWLEFDVVVATPDMMKEIAKLGKILGTKGLMPSPKAGTVTQDIGQAVKELKAGKIEFRVDKASDIHVPIGKISFDTNKICENAESVIDAILRAKPASSKGKYMKSLSICSTMGPGVKLDVSQVAG